MEVIFLAARDRALSFATGQVRDFIFGIGDFPQMADAERRAWRRHKARRGMGVSVAWIMLVCVIAFPRFYSL